MKFRLYRENGALNSKPIFDAVEKGLKSLGHDIVHANEDIPVIWSVLWHGRMAKNKYVWDEARKQNKPVIVLEVGGIKRGTTWKVGLNGINRDAFFSDAGNDSSRSDLLNLRLKPWRTDGEYILLCGQHDRSQQWNMLPSMERWVVETVENIRTYTARPIIFRPHPRCPVSDVERRFKNVIRQQPRHLPDTYDDFDMDFKNVYCTVSWTSNPGIHSVLEGVPSYTSPSSLAWPVSIKSLTNLENPPLPDRTQWLNDYAHTEWTVKEIAQGLPLKSLLNSL
jgi:hypothetical protein